MFVVCGRTEASARQYRAEAEQKVQVQLKLRQQVEINNGIQIKLAGLEAAVESANARWVSLTVC